MAVCLKFLFFLYEIRDWAGLVIETVVCTDCPHSNQYGLLHAATIQRFDGATRSLRISSSFLILTNGASLHGQTSSSTLFTYIPYDLLHSPSLNALPQRIVMLPTISAFLPSPAKEAHLPQPIHPPMISDPNHMIPLRLALFRTHSASTITTMRHHSRRSTLNHVDRD